MSRCALVIAATVLASACGDSAPAKPTTPPPVVTKPAPEPEHPAGSLKADLEVFCGPEAAAKTENAKSDGLSVIGPWLEAHIQSSEMRTMLGQLKDGRTTINEFGAQMTAALQANHVSPCPTFDRLFLMPKN